MSQGTVEALAVLTSGTLMLQSNGPAAACSGFTRRCRVQQSQRPLAPTGPSGGPRAWGTAPTGGWQAR